MNRALPLCLLLFVSEPVEATTFTAGLGCNGPGISDTQSWPNIAVPTACQVARQPVSGFSPNGTAAADSQASASAGPQGIRVSAETVLTVAGATAGQASSAALAYGESIFDDFLITGPGASSVPAALNLFLSGTLGNLAFGDQSGPLTTNIANGVGSIYLEIEINGAYAGSGQAYYAANVGSVVAVDLLANSTFTNGSIAEFVQSGQLMLPVGQIFSVRIYVSANASGTLSITGTPADQFDTVNASAFGESQFGSTITFAKSGPVFDLPPGYTVDSPSAGVVNNQLVPEPGAASLLGAAALALGAGRRRSAPRIGA